MFLLRLIEGRLTQFNFGETINNQISFVNSDLPCLFYLKYKLLYHLNKAN